jgi:type IV fimbrial biogenesis protein FimT
MSKICGVTLIELLLVMAISAILLTLAVPSFTSVIRSMYVSSAMNFFMSDVRLARSEAVRRNRMVVMCRSDAPEVAVPKCGSGGGIDLDGDYLGDGWASGWIIFEDATNTKDYVVGAKLIRVQGAIQNIGSISGRPNSSVKLQFTPTGRLRSLSGATSITFGGIDFSSSQRRMLCIAMSGRVSNC